MISSSVQFKGKDQVLSAYESRKVEVWSLWQGRQFLTKGTGVEELDAFISMLAENSTNAIYTLMIFEGMQVKDVKSKTEHDGSFNFRLNSETQEITNAQYSAANSNKAVLAELAEIRKRLDDEEDEDEEEEEPQDIMGIIGGILKDPEKLEKFIDLGKRLSGQPVQPAHMGTATRIADNSNAVGQSSAGHLASSGGPAENLSHQADRESLVKRLGIAIDTLEKNDPKIVLHLEQLAGIAVNNPAQFKFLLSMLESWK
jgi:hypothetical protein